MKPNLLLFILEKFRDPKPKFQSLTLYIYIYIHTYEFKLQNKTTSGAAVDPHLNAPIRIWNSIELPWVHRKKTLAKQGLVWYILQKNHKICNRPGGDLHPCFLNIRSNQIAIRGIDLSFGAGIPEQLTHPGCCYNARLPPSAPSASPSAYWPCLSLIGGFNTPMWNIFPHQIWSCFPNFSRANCTCFYWNQHLDPEVFQKKS